jgi:hypothetical protein
MSGDGTIRSWRSRTFMGAVILVWGVAVAGTMAWVTKYKSTPAAAIDVPATWPAASSIVRTDGVPTLVMLAHPYCPCTRASIHELGQLMSHVRGRVATYVLMAKLADTPSGWERSATWEAAAKIPGVTVLADPEGREAAHFGVTVSGDVRVYDTRGQLRFSGGITPARGHEGDAVWRANVLPLLEAAPAFQPTVASVTAPAFGCRLGELEARGPSQPLSEANR